MFNHVLRILAYCQHPGALLIIRRLFDAEDEDAPIATGTTFALRSARKSVEL
tara:strand:- start:179 stop:334 length:156 start_codon:yes stop_codon:yes gene_type:complete